MFYRLFYKSTAIDTDTQPSIVLALAVIIINNSFDHVVA
jgi:hypothetical protein